MSLPADHRTARWIADLDANLQRAAELVARGEHAFHADPALPLAFEALSTRVGELAKRLASADPARFSDPIWAQAARNRDFLVHHYDRIDSQALWITVSVSFPELGRMLRSIVDSDA
ncbi:HepT-like ribonuclease domain-containing protein [Salinibacterium sp. ZJ454]|uniref:HepT-like ribonuclease domain-containing protein n=1 Tax=Salinibacterium sp. ZJ454 TaxID=2708339 RepID=UPI00141FC471|nr:HepT-like ribonuclease domain-containing protein [Salinibacterium sp. ZJ454]